MIYDDHILSIFLPILEYPRLPTLFTLGMCGAREWDMTR